MYLDSTENLHAASYFNDYLHFSTVELSMHPFVTFMKLLWLLCMECM